MKQPNKTVVIFEGGGGSAETIQQNQQGFATCFCAAESAFFLAQKNPQKTKTQSLANNVTQL